MEDVVREAMKTFRVVSLTGARQVGKTTLVQHVCEQAGMRHVSLEDPVKRAAAQADPDAWLAANGTPLMIDEVQHVPELFRAIKLAVDRASRPGMYVLTGSALWLSMKKIGESLAGRAAILELWPFRPSEWRENVWNWEILFQPDWNPHTLKSPAMDMKELKDSVLRGGLPEPAGFASPRQRALWFESYLRTYLQRDVLDLAHIEHLDQFTRLIRLLAARTGTLVNQSALARDLGLPQPTIRRYITWLQTTYQCHALPPYSTNVVKRLVKTPKLYWTDTGMAATLAGCGNWVDLESAQLTGPWVETWVVNDVRAWQAHEPGVSLSFWRNHDGGAEADLLIEKSGRIVAIEIKLGRRIDLRDLKGLKECQAALGSRLSRAVVLYGGDTVQMLGNGITALPISLVLGS